MVSKKNCHHLQVMKDCTSCPMREQNPFCNLEPNVSREVETVRRIHVYSPGKILFVEGESPCGILILCSGSVKLALSSVHGRPIILRMARQGEVLALDSVILNAPCEFSAETVELSQVSFISSNDFLHLLRHHGEISMRVSRALGMELRHAYGHAAAMALASTTSAKLAGLLLEWADRDAQFTPGRIDCNIPLTHEEIGALIGTTRETVTRLLGDFRRRGLIDIDGGVMELRKRTELESIFSGNLGSRCD